MARSQDRKNSARYVQVYAQVAFALVESKIRVVAFRVVAYRVAKSVSGTAFVALALGVVSALENAGDFAGPGPDLVPRIPPYEPREVALRSSCWVSGIYVADMRLES